MAQSQAIAEREETTTSGAEQERVYPSAAFRARAHINSLAQYRRLHQRALADPEGFWGDIARELVWFRPWDQVLVWEPPFARWFVGGRINVAYNCLDRHLDTGRRHKAAIVWEGEPGQQRTLTYQQLHREVSRFANALKALGVGAGDRVALYLPMIPELAIAMLACARIGAVHSVIFGGFSAQALAERITDAQAKVVVTADGGYRRGHVVPLKANTDAAVARCPSVEKVVVVRRTGQPVPMTPGRDLWWHELVAAAAAHCPAEPLPAEHPLFILYTSGTTGKPKGVVHASGGYLVMTYITTKWVFDLRDEDLYWCTADIGWVTGHSYVVYGPLANGATTFMYEGAPDYPRRDRFWDIVERHGVNILYTAPTAIRAFMGWGEEWPQRHDLSSLRLLGTVGEPINPEAWRWYYRTIGGERCPVVDTWWQTETGAILITTLPGAMPAKPGSAALPFPGVDAEVVDAQGRPRPLGQPGYLVLRRPWPAMLATLYGEAERYRQAYWSQIPGVYFTGDGARRDQDGYFWLLGRVDDVINVAGHRLGTAEVESALVSHPAVAEAAVVGFPHPVKGDGIYAFVTLADGYQPDEALKQELRAHVAQVIGPIARPDEVRFSPALPKTRSGKIMRRLLRDIAAGRQELGDISTLEDVAVLERLREEAD